MASSALVQTRTDVSSLLVKPDGAGTSYEDKRARQIEQAVSNPPPPIAYQGIRTGPEIEIGYEPNIAAAMGMDESLLRKLSPFILQLEPPLVFGQDGGFTQQKKTASINIYGDALSSQEGPYQSARDRLVKTSFVKMDYRVSSGEEYYAKNQHSQVGNKGPADSPTDSKGQGAPKLGPPAIADVYAALDIATQLSAILNAPPLVLLLNPENMAMSYSKIQQFQDRSRFGYIYQGWGEEQPRLAITAKCGAFVSGGRGVQFASKRDSKAWQNLMGAFTFYKSNGYIYDTVGKSNANHFVGALSIHYDQWVYYGHMESFNYTYDETKQNGGIEFQMEFVVSLMMDTAPPTSGVRPMRSPVPSPSDPRYAGMAPAPVGFSSGLGGVGLTLPVQEREVGSGTSILAMTSQGGPSVGKQSGTRTQPVGLGGFQVASVAAASPLTQLSPGHASPFGR